MEEDYGRCVACVMSDHLLITFSVTPTTRLLLRSRVISHERVRAGIRGKEEPTGAKETGQVLANIGGVLLGSSIMMNSSRIREVDSISSTGSKMQAITVTGDSRIFI